MNQLTAWLQELAEEEQAALDRRGLTLGPRSDCPPLSRWRRIVLREIWRLEDRSHLRECSFCRLTVEQMRQDLWHPTAAQLFWHGDRLPDAGEDETGVAYHLDQDDCQRCHRRLALLRGNNPRGFQARKALGGSENAARRLQDCLDRWGVVRLQAFAPRNPWAAAAQSGTPLERTNEFPDAAFLAEGALFLNPECSLVEDAGRYVLEVKTRNAAWNHQLLRYVFKEAAGRPLLRGFLMVRPDAPGWYTAARSLDPQLIFSAAEGRDLIPEVSVVDIQELTVSEGAALLESIKADQNDAEAYAAWRIWSENLARRSDRLTDDLQRLVELVRGLWRH